MPGSTSKLSLTGSQDKDNQRPGEQQEQATVEQKRQDEYRRVLKELAGHGPLTRRQLNHLTRIEIASLCRCLYDLCYKRKVVKVAYTAVCRETGKRVYHYALSSRLEQKEGGDQCTPA